MADDQAALRAALDAAERECVLLREELAQTPRDGNADELAALRYVAKAAWYAIKAWRSMTMCATDKTEAIVGLARALDDVRRRYLPAKETDQ